MNLSRVIAIFALTTVSFVTSCGGDSGGSNASATDNSADGSSGARVTSKGTIDGFGSIFVNGVEFDTDRADVYLNGKSSIDNDLEVGMVVTVSGNVHDSGTSGTASDIHFDADVQGPISSLAPGPDEDTVSLIIFDTEVLVERGGTVIDGTDFDTLAIDDFVEVSGFIDQRLRIRATHIAKKPDPPGGKGAVKLSGYISTLTKNEFILTDIIVDHSNANLSGFPGNVLIEGRWVDVFGLFDSGRITAKRISVAVGSRIADNVKNGDEISVAGTVFCRATCNTEFNVDEFQVDATEAEIYPADLIIEEGLVVQVDGTWHGYEFEAERILLRRGRVEVAGSLRFTLDTDESHPVSYSTGIEIKNGDSGDGLFDHAWHGAWFLRAPEARSYL